MTERDIVILRGARTAEHNDCPMPAMAGNRARRYEISRKEQDDFGSWSQTAAAQGAGLCAEDIVPVAAGARSRDCSGRRGRAILGAMKLLIRAMIGLAAAGSWSALVQAEEQKPSINASLLLNNVLSQPVDHQQRQLAFDEALRHPGPTPAKGMMEGEVQPDGSVRYGNLTVSSIKNPCPPGEHVEVPATPVARRARK
jgi:Thiolase, N-terminal domain